MPNTPETQAILDNAKEEASLIIEVGEAFRIIMDDLWTGDISYMLERCMIKVLYQRQLRKEKGESLINPAIGKVGGE